MEPRAERKEKISTHKRNLKLLREAYLSQIINAMIQMAVMHNKHFFVVLLMLRVRLRMNFSVLGESRIE